MEKYNLVVVGAGSAGLMAAAGAAGLGAKVALVERGKMGGDCLNYGCIPSKTLLRHAKTVARVRNFGLAGRPPEDRVDGEDGEAADRGEGLQAGWERASARVAEVIAAIAPHDSVERFQSLGVDVVPGRGRIVSRGAVEVALAGGGTRTLEGNALVIATGSRPLVPPIPGLAEAGYLTNETVFTHPEFPPRLLVLGGGPIGVELGQAFARLGSRVTLVEMMPRILPREDADAAEVVARSLAADGVRLLTGYRAERVESAPGEKRVVCQPGHGGDGEPERGVEPVTVEVDQILVAVGRLANTAGLGLEEAGVVIENGRIRVDGYMRTTVPSIYACGDVTGLFPFTHMAGQQARVVIQNALLPLKSRIGYRVVPWCTFTDPELARVGLSEEEAIARGTPHRVIRVPFSGIDRAVCDGEGEGFLKILTHPRRDDILGATLVGAHAGELLHELVLAMSARLRLRDIANTVHIYPTLAEIFRRAGDEARKASFTPTLQRLLGGYLRWRRR